MKSKVLILHADESSIYSNIKKSFETFPNILNKRIKTISIKLNICAIKLPEAGATSNPALVEAVVLFLRERFGSNIEINLIESDAIYNRNINYVFKLMGFQSIAEKYDLNCINLSKDSTVKKRIDGYVFKEFDVPKTLLESDLFITLPKLKTHHVAKISCGLKNQYGCFPKRNKFTFHPFLDEAIVDANLFRPPDFVIVDGILGMVGSGSFFGLTKRFNLLIASDDIVAADCVCAKVLGFNPYFVGQIRKAARKGLGSMRYEVLGETLKNIKVNIEFDKKNYYLEKFFKILMRLSG